MHAAKRSGACHLVLSWQVGSCSYCLSYIRWMDLPCLHSQRDLSIPLQQVLEPHDAPELCDQKSVIYLQSLFGFQGERCDSRLERRARRPRCHQSHQLHCQLAQRQIRRALRGCHLAAAHKESCLSLMPILVASEACQLGLRAEGKLYNLQAQSPA